MKETLMKMKMKNSPLYFSIINTFNKIFKRFLLRNSSNLEMIPHEDLLSEISKLNENTAIENSYEEQRNPNDNGASHLYHKEYFGYEPLNIND